MKTYFWKDQKNFGDLLTSLLLKKFTHLSSEWADPEKSELIMVGSILEQIPHNWKGVIAGAGALHRESILKFPNANIIGIRGYLTAKLLGVNVSNIVIGDPALLADELIPIQDKQYDIGIIPHWTDKTLEHNPIFKSDKYTTKIIRVSDDPLEVIKQIGLCRKIVSSSLHGIILADAFSIPRRTEIAPRILSHPQQEGDLFKFQDYSSSINLPLQIGVLQQADVHIIADKQYELYDMFIQIKNLFK